MNVERISFKPHISAWFKVAVFAAVFLLVLLLQQLGGAYRSEFGGYPDEPAHYVTSVMVRDFILSGNYNKPVQFATEYYKHYPKVAFGHWPPLLYAVQGVWMILFSVSRASVMVELALTTAVAAFLLFLVAARHFGRWAGVGCAALLVCLPEIQVYSNQEMAESLLLLTTFQATVFFYRYLEENHWRDSFWFAIFCSLAILTKGNGWALAMVPPIAIVLTRDWKVLARPSFWIPLPVVVLLCLPWQVMTLEMANRGWTGGTGPNLPYTLHALGAFAAILWSVLGSALAALALLGMWLRVVAPFLAKRVKPLDAAMFGLIVSMWLFHSVVPAGVESRKLLNAIPAALLFAFAGGEWVARRLQLAVSGFRIRPALSYIAVPALTLIMFLTEVFSIPTERHYGFTELSRYIETRPNPRNSVILVSSERDGEGLLISELVMREHRLGHTVLRATKVLSSSDWNGNITSMVCNSAGDIMSLLKREQVRDVVVDTFPPRLRYRHHELLLQAIHDFPEAWHLESTFGDGQIRLYAFNGAAQVARQ